MLNSEAASSCQGLSPDKKPKRNVQAMSRRSYIPRNLPHTFQRNFARRNLIKKAVFSNDVVSSKGLCGGKSNTPHLSSMGEMTFSANGYHPKNPVVAIIGTGYVGLQLVVTFSQKYRTIAFDIREDRIKEIASLARQEPNIFCSTDPGQLANATHFLIAVPTGLSYDGKRVDVSSLHAALGTIEKYARQGATVVIESSVAVGMTRNLLGPLLVKKGLKGGMSPERVDPGRTQPPSNRIPKIISGLDDISPGSLASIESLYSSIFPNLVKVSTPEVAEMTKLYENCQRMVCIAYANEMADACAVHNIDPFEVSSAAATKPFGYCPITPGIGAGGSCIPINPYYLFLSGEFPLLKIATQNTWDRPSVIADQTMISYRQSSSKQVGLSRPEPSILVIGVGFKAGQSLITCSPAVALIQRLKIYWKANVTFADPLVYTIPIPNVARLDESKEWHKQRLEEFDIIFVANKQEHLDLVLLDTLKDVRLIICCP